MSCTCSPTTASALGDDGPTHQPVEHLAALRAIPNLTVIRPGDANETAVAWRVALETRDRPVVLVLTRQNVPTLDRARYAPAEGLRRGGYVLSDAPDGKPALLLIASGSEVGLIVAAAERLNGEGIAVRCVSMPSWELFNALSTADRDAVLPPSVGARLAVETGVAQGWRAYVGRRRRRPQRRALRRLGAGWSAAARIRFHRRQRVCSREGALGSGRQPAPAKTCPAQAAADVGAVAHQLPQPSGPIVFDHQHDRPLIEPEMPR